MAGVHWLQRNDTLAGKERKVLLAGVPNVKVNGYCAENNEDIVYRRFFGHGCQCIPNKHKPIGNKGETLLSRHEETQERVQKIKRWLYGYFDVGV